MVLQLQNPILLVSEGVNTYYTWGLHQLPGVLCDLGIVLLSSNLFPLFTGKKPNPDFPQPPAWRMYFNFCKWVNVVWCQGRGREVMKCWAYHMVHGKATRVIKCGSCWPLSFFLSSTYFSVSHSPGHHSSFLSDETKGWCPSEGARSNSLCCFSS